MGKALASVPFPQREKRPGRGINPATDSLDSCLGLWIKSTEKLVTMNSRKSPVNGLWEQIQNVRFLLLAHVDANTNQRASITKETPDNEADRITWPINISVTGHSWVATMDLQKKSRHDSRNTEYVWSHSVRKLSSYECQKTAAPWAKTFTESPV